MRDISLHILDLIENSTRAGATHVIVAVEQRDDEDLLMIAIEDNGPGLPVSVEQAANPFFTTKKGKKIGLGLSFFRAAAERAGGSVTIRRSVLGGLAVNGRMQLNHIDRSPIGDLPMTMTTAVMSSPDVRFSVRIRANGQEQSVDSEVLRQRPSMQRRDAFAIAQAFSIETRTAMATLKIAQ